jgi:hypothetical protein
MRNLCSLAQIYPVVLISFSIFFNSLIFFFTEKFGNSHSIIFAKYIKASVSKNLIGLNSSLFAQHGQHLGGESPLWVWRFH